MDFEQFERICVAAAHYYLQAEPAPHHFLVWINSLQEPEKTSFKERGFEGCREALSFRRFVAEINDQGLEAHMQQQLSAEDYLFWQQI